MTEEEKRELCLSWIRDIDELGLDEIIKEYELE